MGLPPTGLAFGKDLLELLLLSWEKEHGKLCPWQLNCLFWGFLLDSGSFPTEWLSSHSFICGALSCGLWYLSVTLALDLGKQVQWNYNSVRVRQTCV